MAEGRRFLLLFLLGICVAQVITAPIPEEIIEYEDEVEEEPEITTKKTLLMKKSSHANGSGHGHSTVGGSSHRNGEAAATSNSHINDVIEFTPRPKPSTTTENPHAHPVTHPPFVPTTTPHLDDPGDLEVNRMMGLMAGMVSSSDPDPAGGSGSSGGNEENMKPLEPGPVESTKSIDPVVPPVPVPPPGSGTESEGEVDEDDPMAMFQKLMKENGPMAAIGGGLALILASSVGFSTKIISMLKNPQQISNISDQFKKVMKDGKGPGGGAPVDMLKDKLKMFTGGKDGKGGPLGDKLKMFLDKDKDKELEKGGQKDNDERGGKKERDRDDRTERAERDAKRDRSYDKERENNREGRDARRGRTRDREDENDREERDVRRGTGGDTEDKIDNEERSGRKGDRNDREESRARRGKDDRNDREESRARRGKDDRNDREESRTRRDRDDRNDRDESDTKKGRDDKNDREEIGTRRGRGKDDRNDREESIARRPAERDPRTKQDRRKNSLTHKVSIEDDPSDRSNDFDPYNGSTDSYPGVHKGRAVKTLPARERSRNVQGGNSARESRAPSEFTTIPMVHSQEESRRRDPETKRRESLVNNPRALQKENELKKLGTMAQNPAELDSLRDLLDREDELRQGVNGPRGNPFQAPLDPRDENFWRGQQGQPHGAIVPDFDNPQRQTITDAFPGTKGLATQQYPPDLGMRSAQNQVAGYDMRRGSTLPGYGSQFLNDPAYSQRASPVPAPAVQYGGDTGLSRRGSAYPMSPASTAGQFSNEYPPIPTHLSRTGPDMRRTTVPSEYGGAGTQQQFPGSTPSGQIPAEFANVDKFGNVGAYGAPLQDDSRMGRSPQLGENGPEAQPQQFIPPRSSGNPNLPQQYGKENYDDPRMRALSPETSRGRPLSPVFSNMAPQGNEGHLISKPQFDRRSQPQPTSSASKQPKLGNGFPPPTPGTQEPFDKDEAFASLDRILESLEQKEPYEAFDDIRKMEPRGGMGGGDLYGGGGGEPGAMTTAAKKLARYPAGVPVQGQDPPPTRFPFKPTPAGGSQGGVQNGVGSNSFLAPPPIRLSPVPKVIVTTPPEGPMGGERENMVPRIGGFHGYQGRREDEYYDDYLQNNQRGVLNGQYLDNTPYRNALGGNQYEQVGNSRNPDYFREQNRNPML